MKDGWKERAEAFRRNPRLSGLLRRLNQRLGSHGDVRAGTALKYPLFLIIGPPRSGSTLLFQLLANSGKWGYPSNLISRFYGDPALGAMVQAMLSDKMYDYRDELQDLGLTGMIPDYSSDAGKTRGFRAPNEFYFFWRRFFRDTDLPFPCFPGPDEFRISDFHRELADLEAVFRKPLILKGIIANGLLPELVAEFPKIILLRMTRNPLQIAQSLLRIRERFFGTTWSWYSFGTKACLEVLNESPMIQIATQITEIEKIVSDGLRNVPTEKVFEIDYEDLCRAPGRMWDDLRGQVLDSARMDLGAYTGPQKFHASTAIHLTPAEVTQFKETSARLATGSPRPRQEEVGSRV